MANKRRIIPITFNVPAQQVVGDAEALTVVTDLLQFRRFDQALILWTLVDDAGEAYALDAGTTFLFGIDNVFTPGHADLVLSPDAEFNVAGDWADVDLAEGKISNRADCATAELATALAAAESANMYAVLWAIPPLPDKPYLLAHIKITMGNVAVEPGPTTALPDPETVYVTYGALYQFQTGEAVNGASPVAVVFAKTFPDVPVIQATLGDDADELLQVEILTRTTSGFTFQVRGAAGVVADPYNVLWQAAQAFSIPDFRVQHGLGTKDAGDTFVDIVFPVEFDEVPVVTCTLFGDHGERVTLEVIARSTTTVRVQARNAAGIMNAEEVNFLWLAIAANS